MCALKLEPEGRPEEAQEKGDRPVVIALVGPTGSGKTGLGVKLAQALETEVISVDAMAVYRGMDIGTAKPDPQEMQGVTHHLIDVVEPDEPFTAAHFAAQAGPIIDALHARGKPALLVGGTGLYLRALVHGLFQGPPTDPELRAKLQEEADQAEAAGVAHPLHARLQEVDAETAGRLHPHDHVRLVRALEVYYSTGKPISQWQRENAFQTGPYRVLKLALSLPKEVLHARIDARVLDMVARGLEAETARLLERFGAEIKPMRALGYLHFTQYLRGLWGLEETIATLQRDTRRFSRRQLTWFKGEPGTRWVEPDWTTVWESVRKFVEMGGVLG